MLSGARYLIYPHLFGAAGGPLNNPSSLTLFFLNSLPAYDKQAGREFLWKECCVSMP